MFQHLILTGRNGSGKTSTLTLLHHNLLNGRRFFAADGTLRDRSASDLAVAGRLVPDPHGEIQKQVLLLEARRNHIYRAVQGPNPGISLLNSEDLEQHLVNLRTQIAYANEEGDQESARVHQERLNHYEKALQFLFESPDLRLEFRREKIRYQLVFDSRRVGFNELPDGFGSALHIWSALQALCQSGGDDWGIVLIDEIEANLHLSLQERLLPFLTASFPRIQFVVATHSPAVIASIDGAIVYDLSSHTAVRSEDLRGLQYGTIMTGHFGISSDSQPFTALLRSQVHPSLRDLLD